MQYPQDFVNKIVCGDCCTLMKGIPSESVDICVTSPPYSKIRDYQGFTFNFETTAIELTRILKNGGVICWIINDQYVDGSRDLESYKQALFFKEKCGLKVHDIMVYQKRNFSHPSFNRYHQVWEQVQIFSKDKPKTFNPIKDRKNLTAGAVGNLGVNTFTEKDGSKSVRDKKITSEFGMRHNVWIGNTRGQEEMCIKLKHPAMMPKWLVRDLIISWSNKNEIVFDPFVGSGTVCKEAQKLERSFIGMDVSQEYCSLANASL